MSLADRLANIEMSPGNQPNSCGVCRWEQSLPDSDRKAVEEWYERKGSLVQLWEIASRDADHPLPLGVSSLRNHVRRHRGT